MNSARERPARAHEFYPTPTWCAELCARRINGLVGLKGKRILEPHAGAGDFAMALAEYAEVWTNELHPVEGFRPDYQQDFAVFDDGIGYDVVAGNPPFSLAVPHIKHALTLAPTVSFLLRLAFLETKARQAFFAEHPPRWVDVLTKRPSFTADGKTDSAAYALFTWRRGHQGAPALGWL